MKNIKVTFNKKTNQFDVVCLMYSGVIASFSDRKSANQFRKTIV